MAAIAASLSAALSQREPLRVRPERCLPAERSLPGHCPAQEARWRAEGNTVNVGADLGDDDLGGAPLNAGDRAQQLNRALESGDAFLDRVREPLDLLIQEIQVREDRADE